MYELDKVRFGLFVAELRKAQGMTQKELAQRLYVSDKAVSKWERGLSVPDAALLVPLAEVLEVTVTELLEGRAMEPAEPMDVRRTDEVVRKVIGLSEERRKQLLPGKPRRLAELLACAAVCAVELTALLALGYEWDELVFAMGVHLALYLILGGAFSLFAAERLPDYYDTNRISNYNGGWLRMNIPGLYINNNNWPYVLLCIHLWAMVGLTAVPLVYFAGSVLLPEIWPAAGVYVLLALSMAGLFLPCYIVGKKHE